MKKFNLFKMLAVLIVLITSINTAWGYYGIQLRSDYYTGGWGWTSDVFDYGGDGQKYWDVYHTGYDSYWRIKIGEHDYGPTGSSNFQQNVGYAGYKVGRQSTYSFKTSDDAGILRICTNQKSGGEYTPYVWVERPGVVFKHNWNGGGSSDWTEVNATDNRNGTYTYWGTYGGTNYFNAKSVNGAWKVAKTSTTVLGSPNTGDRCEFKWTPSGYKLTGDEETNRGVFVITKIDTITFDANGGIGSLPALQEVVYNQSTQLNGSHSLKKTGGRFLGWNTNKNGGVATRIAVDGYITVTASTTLYAEWEDSDPWCIRGVKESGSGTDYLGGWSAANPPYFTYGSAYALSLTLYLGASQTYKFKIVNTTTNKYFGNTGTITSSITNDLWTFEKDKGDSYNCTLTTSTAGYYTFLWNANTNVLRVYFPSESAKAYLKPQKYIYLDGATNSNSWKVNGYKARFWFKAMGDGSDYNLTASGVDCSFSNSLGIDYMYYVKVIDNEYIDRFQVNRVKDSDGTFWNGSGVEHVEQRDNAGQNCLVVPSGAGWDDIDLTWKTYCPPMTSATIIHDGENTKTYGGNGESGTPYIVAAGSNIYVSAISESKLDDDNMTPHYQFMKNSSTDGDYSATSTHTFSTTGTNNATYDLSVVAKNYYNSTYGDPSSTNNTIYYLARTPYSVTPDLTNMTVAYGQTGTAAIVDNVEYMVTLANNTGYDLPEDVTVTCGASDITDNCDWDDESGILTIPAEYVTGNIAITAAGVAKTYTAADNLKNPDNTTAGTYQVTYDATSIEFVGDAPTKTGYDIEGFYATNTAGELSDKIANGDRSLVSSTTYTSGGQWKYDDGAPTLYINWTAHEYSITYKDKGDETFTGNNSGSLPTTHTYSSPTELVDATKTGYRFDGWYADAACTSRVYSLGATTYTDDITLYAKWTLIVSSDNANFDGYTTPSTYNDVLVTNGATLTISTSKTVQDITVETGSTLNVAKGASGITFTVNSLSLIGGWGTVGGDTKYDMPRVYIDPKSTLSKTESAVNFDVVIDNRNYYPIAVPFPVNVEDVDYANTYLAGFSRYGFSGQYAIKKYNGQQRADRGSNYANWEIMDDGEWYGTETETLVPGHGYIVTALPAPGYDDGYAVLRFPMTVDDAWTTEGEQGSATISAKTITKNEVAVYNYHIKEGETPKNHKGWNLLAVPFMSCYASSSFDEDPDGAYIKGKLNFSTGAYTDETHVYVSVPTYDFSEYIQSTIDEVVLLPGWCFFVQFDEEGTLTFKTAGERVSAPFRATKNDQSMPTVKTGIILSGAEVSDKTTILVSDKYSASEYEINADLEKLFGENSYTLATYSLSGETRLAYNAMSNADATQMIPIGYRAPEAGEYTFSINPRYADGTFGSVNLIDYETNTVTDLLQSSYTFSTERTQNDARFALNVVPAPAVITAIENNADGTNNGARKILLDGKMYIILNGQMYDATGALVK